MTEINETEVTVEESQTERHETHPQAQEEVVTQQENVVQQANQPQAETVVIDEKPGDEQPKAE